VKYIDGEVDELASLKLSPLVAVCLIRTSSSAFGYGSGLSSTE